MLIDWFTVIAQIINFLILVWLLKRFLYKPILNAIKEREKKIASQLRDADQAKAETQKEREEFQQKNDEFDRQRKDLLTKASEEASVERNRLLEEARKESESLRLKQRELLKNEYRDLNQKIVRRTQHEVFAIARKTLSDLATADLEESIAGVFIQHLRKLDYKEKELLISAIKSTSCQVRIRSAFDLLPEHQVAIESAVRETLTSETKVLFETAPDLVSGIELITNGHKVSWNIADYIASLEKSVDELLEEKAKPKAEKGTGDAT